MSLTLKENILTQKILTILTEKNIFSNLHKASAFLVISKLTIQIQYNT